MILQFGVGFYEEDGTYRDNPVRIAQRYVMAPTLFLFDLVTSIPFAYVDLSTYMVRCGHSHGPNPTIYPATRRPTLKFPFRSPAVPSPPLQLRPRSLYLLPK